MKDFTYVQSNEAKSTLNDKIRTIQELASSVHLIPLKEEPVEIKDDDDWTFVKETKTEINDDDDWAFVKETNENHTSQHLASESFEMLYKNKEIFGNYFIFYRPT